MRESYKGGLGIPYMGSKRKIANEIIGYILKKNKDAKYFYALFGGGGAISFEALQKHQFKKVFYNELNGGIVYILKDIRDNVMTEKYYKLVGSDEIEINNTSEDSIGGLTKVV